MLLFSSPLHAQDDEDAVEVVAIEAMQLAPAKAEARKKGAPLPFLKPVINSEISFIKRVCNPTDEQMQAIIAAATKAYQATGDMIEENQQFFGAGQVRVMGPNNEQLSENPFRRIRRDAKAYLEPLVSPQQYTLYKTEVYMRDNFERSAAIAIVVGIVDEKIALTDEQRSLLIDHLMQKWEDVDLQSIQNYIYNPEYVPQLPPDTIEKVITPRQLKSWQSFQQVNFGMNFSFDEDGMGLSGEDWIK